MQQRGKHHPIEQLPTTQSAPREFALVARFSSFERSTPSTRRGPVLYMRDIHVEHVDTTVQGSGVQISVLAQIHDYYA